MADNSRSGFQLLRDTVAEKYNLEYQETISKSHGLVDHNVVFKYASQDKLNFLFFYCDCDYVFASTQRDGRIDNESIVLVNNKMISECLEEGIKLYNQRKAIKEQERLEEQRKLKKISYGCDINNSFKNCQILKFISRIMIMDVILYIFL